MKVLGITIFNSKNLKLPYVFSMEYYISVKTRDMSFLTRESPEQFKMDKA